MGPLRLRRATIIESGDFKQRNLPIFIEIGLRVGGGFSNELSKTRVVLFVTTARRRDNHPVSRREFVQEWAARRGAVDDGQRTAKRFQPLLKFAGRKVRAAQVEPGFLAVERAVADEHQPKFARQVLWLPRQRLLQLFQV